MNRDVAGRLLELAQTGLEALEYVQEQTGQGNYEGAISVFTDVLHSFSEIEDVLDSNHIAGVAELASATESLRDGFDWMVKAYAGGKQGDTLDIVQLTLIPRYQRWLEELQKELSSNIEV